MKIKPKNNVELQKMRNAGELAARTLDFITPKIEPGITTEQINRWVHDFTIEHNAIPAPLNYRGFPKSVCTSINDVVCHGIPNEQTILKEGDIVNIDVTSILDEYHGDTSRMFLVGDVSDEARKLVQTTYDAMMAGIKTVQSGSYLSDIGKAIEHKCTPHAYGVVRDFCGHGIGKVFHENPQVLHYAYDDKRADCRLRKGMTFTVEPMVNIGGFDCYIEEDNWTARTSDGSLSAQFEHTLAVTENGFEIFTQSPRGWHHPGCY